jgi:hypothetical protein
LLFRVCLEKISVSILNLKGLMPVLRAKTLQINQFAVQHSKSKIYSFLRLRDRADGARVVGLVLGPVRPIKIKLGIAPAPSSELMEEQAGN